MASSHDSPINTREKLKDGIDRLRKNYDESLSGKMDIPDFGKELISFMHNLSTNNESGNFIGKNNTDSVKKLEINLADKMREHNKTMELGNKEDVKKIAKEIQDLTSSQILVKLENIYSTLANQDCPLPADLIKKINKVIAKHCEFTKSSSPISPKGFWEVEDEGNLKEVLKQLGKNSDDYGIGKEDKTKIETILSKVPNLISSPDASSNSELTMHFSEAIEILRKLSHAYISTATENTDASEKPKMNVDGTERASIVGQFFDIAEYVWLLRSNSDRLLSLGQDPQSRILFESYLTASDKLAEDYQELQKKIRTLLKEEEWNNVSKTYSDLAKKIADLGQTLPGVTRSSEDVLKVRGIANDIRKEYKSLCLTALLFNTAYPPEVI